MRRQPFAVLALLISLADVAAFTVSAHSAAPTELGEKGPTRTDRYGDPLPRGAVMRLGTLRFCQPNPCILAFSPDGKFLASGGADNRIRLWDPDTGKELRTPVGHTGYMNRIALSADCKWLASSSQDNVLFLWEVGTGKIRRQFRGHTAPIDRLALSPNGKVLASSCHERTLRLWDTDTGKEIRSLPLDKGDYILAKTFTPDSKYFAFYTRSNGIQLVDVAEGKVIRTFKGHQNDVRELTFTPDGSSLISGGSDCTIRVWDVASGREKRRFGDHRQQVISLALAPDGKTSIYSTYPDGLVHIWDLATNKDLFPPWKANSSLNSALVSIAYSPDGKKVAGVCRDTIAIYETATGKRLNPAPENESQVRQVEYAADGKVLAVWRADETIELWDTAKWRKARTLQPKFGRFRAMAVSPKGKYLTTTEGEFKQGQIKGIICHWDVQTGKRQKEFPQDKGWLEALSFSADGATLACFQSSVPHNVLILWDVATGKERRRKTTQDSGLSNIRLSPDGRLLACETSKNIVVLWDTKTGEPIRRFGKRTSPYSGMIVFSPDGRSIATPAGQGMDGRTQIQPDIVLWETATGQERLHIAGNEGQVSQVVFSPDGRLLASSGQTGTIRLWDGWTGKEVSRFTGHRGWITSLSFAPDGKTLASAGGDRTILIWDVSGLSPAAEPAVEQLSGEELARCWDDLAGADAVRAYRAIAELARRPSQAERLLKNKLATQPGMNAKQLARLIAELDNDDFKTRERASKELAKLGRLAKGALTKALEEKPSVEMTRRVQNLLDRLDRMTEDPQQRLLLRVIEVLERLGTPEARQLLGKLAKEAADPGVAEAATASLERLGKAGRGTP
jgi:WD40 repeat protein